MLSRISFKSSPQTNTKQIRFDPTFFPPQFFVVSRIFLEFPRPGSLKAIAQVLFAPEQAKQAMAERKTEVFGQFATLHPEARLGRSLRRFFGGFWVEDESSFSFNEKKGELWNRGERWENETCVTHTVNGMKLCFMFRESVCHWKVSDCSVMILLKRGWSQCNGQGALHLHRR